MTEHVEEAFEKYYATFNPKSISGDDCWCDVEADKIFIAGYNAATEKLLAEIAELKAEKERLIAAQEKYNQFMDNISALQNSDVHQ